MAGLHGTAHNNLTLRSTAQRSMAQHGTARHSMAQHGTAWHSTAQHGEVQHIGSKACRLHVKVFSLPDLQPGDANPHCHSGGDNTDNSFPGVATAIKASQLPRQEEGQVCQATCGPGCMTCGIMSNLLYNTGNLRGKFGTFDVHTSAFLSVCMCSIQCYVCRDTSCRWINILMTDYMHKTQDTFTCQQL